MDRSIREAIRRRFAGDFKYGHSLVELLEANDLKLNRREELRGGPECFVFLGVPREARERLGIDRDEVLLVALHHAQQHQWFVEETLRFLHRNPRLAKGVLIVASPDTGIYRLCRQASAHPTRGYRTAFVALGAEALVRAKDDEARRALLQGAFEDQAFRLDQFDVKGPVPDDLFGRGNVVTQVEHDLRTSSQGVAILGMRRIGKTSVMHRAISQLENSPGEHWALGYYDAQADTVAASANTAAEELAASLHLSARSQGLSMPPRNNSLTPIKQLQEAVDHIASRTDGKAIVAIDEIEWFVPTRPNSQQGQRGDEFLRLFGALRQLKQRHPDRVSLIICGLNETICEIPRVNGYPNPNLDWYSPRYVGMLSRSDQEDMLRTLGHRMGVAIEDDFLSRLWSDFGGHPYLARQLCSLAWKGLTRGATTLGVDVYDEALGDFEARAGFVLADVMELVANFYPEEYSVLRAMALDRGSGVDGLRAKTRHLRKYGLVSFDPDGKASFGVGVLRKYLADTEAAQVVAGRFRPIHELGRGATGSVWRMFDTEQRLDVAVKVFAQGASEKSVQQERDALIVLQGQYTPRFIGLHEVNGQLHLVMGYVPGRSLESYLNEAGTVAGDPLYSLSRELFAAVAALHPNEARIQELRELGSLEPAQAQELLRLMDSGYLHRDLKPDNIIIENEATMRLRFVDLGLAKPARQASHTRVGTPDYWPPDLGLEKWDPSFDLYAIGRILLRCVLGQLVADDQAPAAVELELRGKEETIVRPAVAFFERALAPTAAQRFRTAEEMRLAWEDAVLAWAE